MKLRSLLVALVPLSLFFACTDDSLDDLNGPVTATIGPDGGTLETQGFRLEVPAGALDEDTTLSVRKLPKAPAGHEARSDVYEMGPKGLVFKKEISVRLDFKGGAGGLAVFHSKLGGGGYDELKGTVEGQQITAAIDHFSQIWAGPGTDDGTGGSGGEGGHGGDGGHGGHGGHGGSGGAGGEGGSGGDGGDGGAGGSGGSDDEALKHLAERFEIDHMISEGAYVYFLNFEGYHRVKKDGTTGDETILNNTEIRALGYLGGNSIVKIVDGDLYVGGESIRRMPAAGGAIENLADAPPLGMGVSSMVVTDTTIYFVASSSESGKNHFLGSVPRDGGAINILRTGTNVLRFGQIAVSNGTIYFVEGTYANSAWTYELKSLPVAGGSATSVMPIGQGHFIPYKAALFFVGDTIYSLDLAGAKKEKVVDGEVNIAALSPDFQTFYYTTGTWGPEVEVFQIASNARDGTGTLLAKLPSTDGGVQANIIAVDDKYVFLSVIGRPDGVHRITR